MVLEDATDHDRRSMWIASEDSEDSVALRDTEKLGPFFLVRINCMHVGLLQMHSVLGAYDPNHCVTTASISYRTLVGDNLTDINQKSAIVGNTINKEIPPQFLPSQTCGQEMATNQEEAAWYSSALRQ